MKVRNEFYHCSRRSVSYDRQVNITRNTGLIKTATLRSTQRKASPVTENVSLRVQKQQAEHEEQGARCS
jgi:hypothetical protein